MSSRHPLNPPQLAAVSHGEGPLLVLAGPGSGKTRVVTHRIARLLERGAPASSVLAVTFTNKAAREMRERVRKLVGQGAKGLTVATFHAACVRILREEIEALGYARNFTIYDESSQQSLVRGILRDLEGSSSSSSAAGLLSEIGWTKSGGSREGRGDAPFNESALERYQQELRARNAIDFDDIILLTARLFREVPEALARWQERFHSILVDEYQDTNASQDEVLCLLAGSRRNLCVVGDDDQSIYGWRGAEVEHILGFTRRFEGAEVVRLEQNYRSTGRIVDVANAVIAKNPHRHAKRVFTESGPGDPVRVVELPEENEEADFIAGEIAASIPPGADAWKEAARCAVLFRTNEQMRPLEQALRLAKVPYRVLGGRSFFDRKEVLDVLAYLRVAGNPDDEESLFRIVNTPARGLGTTALQALSDAARAAGARPWDVLCSIADGACVAGVAGKAAAGAVALVRAVRAVQQEAALGSRSLVTDLIANVGYQDEIDRSYKDVAIRVSRMNLAREVQKAWESYLSEPDRPTLEGFLDSITLRHRDEDDDSGGGATLATIHASKGLEFPVVFVAGLEEGILPHARSLDDPKGMEEERRLFYVAVTRARERLYLSRSVSRTTRGRAVDTVPSRFLEDLPEESIERGFSDAPAAEGNVSANVARLRAMLER